MLSMHLWQPAKKPVACVWCVLFSLIQTGSPGPPRGFFPSGLNSHPNLKQPRSISDCRARAQPHILCIFVFHMLQIIGPALLPCFPRLRICFLVRSQLIFPTSSWHIESLFRFASLQRNSHHHDPGNGVSSYSGDGIADGALAGTHHRNSALISCGRYKDHMPANSNGSPLVQQSHVSVGS